MNYGEEIAYWYLRLNGFFLVTNFVVHRSSRRHPADADLIGIRPPHVYEEVGGKREDWDQEFAHQLGFGHRTIGLICEVKTGRYREDKVFRADFVEYAVGRLGFVLQNEIPAVAEALNANACIETAGGAYLCKLLIANPPRPSERYLTRSLEAAEDFLYERVRRYPLEKYADRMFFPPGLFQQVIHRVHRERERRSSVHELGNRRVRRATVGQHRLRTEEE